MGRTLQCMAFTTFDCHINLEICSNITAVKYIYKYVYKGPDRAEIVIVPAEQEPPNPNEVQEYQRGRYVSASEASLRILQFPMHKEFPSVQRLPVHLPNHLLHSLHLLLWKTWEKE